MLSGADRQALLALSVVSGGDRQLLFKLIRQHKTWRQAWQKICQGSGMAECGVSEKRIAAIHKQKDNYNPEQYTRRLQKHGVHVLMLGDDEYPPALAQIYDAPYVLFVRGSLTVLSERPFAVVGSRAVSMYGREVVAKVIPPLAQVGITIVSGLALGVDVLSQKHCVAAGGKTVAVLGSGIDVIYPRAHTGFVAELLKKGGAIVSEYPLGASTMAHYFPLRNRIIAGLSQGVLVVEAKKQSGALITARLALENNREVFAVPGGVFSPNSAGTNALLQQGAHPVTEAGDIMEALGFAGLAQSGKSMTVTLTKKEREVFDVIGKQPAELDSIIERTGFETDDLIATLTIMQLKGVVEEKMGGRWGRAL